MLKRRSLQRGDTLIEVLFAVTVFSLVAVGALAIMNQGTATSQRALEITLARQQIDAQAEALRFMHSSYVAAYQPGATYAATEPSGQWKLMMDDIKLAGNTQVSSFDESAGGCVAPSEQSFIINTHTVRFVKDASVLTDADTYAKVEYSDVGTIAAKGISIQAVYSRVSGATTAGQVGYVDFHIRACWESPGQTAPVTIGTIVRLYEPGV